MNLLYENPNPKIIRGYISFMPEDRRANDRKIISAKVIIFLKIDFVYLRYEKRQSK